MTRKRKALTLEPHKVSKVFVSREYLEELGILVLALQATRTGNFAKVYEILVEDALKTNDKALLKIVTGEHIIRMNDDGLTFEAV